MAMGVVVYTGSSPSMGLNTLTCLSWAMVLLFSCPSLATVPTDNYGPACTNFPLPDPPPGGFKLWSSASTWGAAGIPGVGSQAGRSIVIGCGVSILLDVPDIRLDILDIQGHLKVLDDGRTKYQVQANAVLVQGQLSIGSPAKHFGAHITFVLTNTTGTDVQITRAPLSGVSTVGSLGTKVFAVVGGQVKLYGMQSTSPSWVKLSSVARKGDTSVVVNADVASLWPIGGAIAIASTDYDADQAEELKITKIDSGAPGRWSRIHFDKALQYMHWGGGVATSIPGKMVDESAEVALLSRNILIQGSTSEVPFVADWKSTLIWSGQRDYPGSTIFHMGDTWPSLCQYVCSVMFGISRPQRCVGFTFSSASRECWLKSSLDDATSVASTFMTTYRVVPPFTTAPTAPAYVKAQTSLDFASYTIREFSGVSIADCEVLCYAAGSVLFAPCVGFQMQPDGTTCALKSQMGTAFLNNRTGVQGYVRRNLVEGGHFIIFHTAVSGGQHIEGVELSNMGQQGILGRYPVHFHFCKDDNKSVVTKCAVHHSNQRCYVVHGTSFVRITNSVGYKNKGHCFMTEEGYERRNNFTGNLAFLQEPVTLKIPTSAKGALQSDDEPTSFWMSNPDNDLINNVAGGAFKSYWYQLEKEVRGSSVSLPGASVIIPHKTTLGLFRGNVAHSSRTGFTLYPPGHGSNTTSRIVGMRSYKNTLGAFMHGLEGGTRVIISGSTFADNGEIGIDSLEGDGRVTVTDSFIVGETENVGNPREYDCQKASGTGTCRPVTGCTMPTPLSNARSQPYGSRYSVLAGIGVSMLGGNGGYFSGSPNYIVRCTFSGFKTSCNRPSAALYLRSGRYKEWFNAANTLSKITIADDGTTAFYIEPQVLSGPYVEKPENNGPNSLSYAFRDSDGSVTGGGGGYIIADNKPMAANYKTRVGALCFVSPKVTNGLVCPGECYRTVFFRWFNTPLLKNWDPAIQLTRASDGVIMTFPAIIPMWDSKIMTVYINLLAGQVYYVTFLAGVPPEFSVRYMEGGPSCPVGVVLRFGAPGPGAIWNTADVLQPWRPEYSRILSPTCTAPMTGETRPTATAASWACQGGATVFYLALGPTLGRYDAQIALTKTGTNAYPCNCNGKGVPASPPITSIPAIKWTMTPPTNVKLTIAAQSSVVFWWGDTLPHSLAGGHSFFVKGPGTFADIRTAPFSTTITFPWSGTWNISCGVYQKRMAASITVVWN